MTPFLAGLLGALIGLVVGGVVASLVWRGRARRVAADSLKVDHVLAAISSMRSVAAVVDVASTAVLAASPPARSTGVVRGSVLVIGALRGLVAEAARDGEPRALDLEVQPEHGASTPLAVRVIPMADGTALLLGEDLSAERRFDLTRRDFVANVTHELKTPIGAISLLAEAVEESNDDPDAVERFAAKIQREAQRLNELVTRIIELSRLQASDPLHAAEPTDVDDLVADVLRASREFAAGRSVSLVVAGKAQCSVAADRAQLQAAVANLVDNAIAYSEPGSKVVISLSVAQSQVAIRVSDTGRGIPAADLPRVFERFYRVDSGRGRNTGGTGLGLAIVKHVAETHGGQVSVWSELGKGSTFTIRLPLG